LHITPPKADVVAEPRWGYKLITTNTEVAPVYETLSYVWGSSDRNELLPLSDGTLLRTTKALYQALPHIGKYCNTGYPWIDQICINQDDLSERAQQVSIMGSIYSRCARVLVWLGPTTSLKSRLAAHCFSLDLAVSCPTDCSECGDVYGDACNKCVDKITTNMTGSRSIEKGLLKLCHEIIENPWFSRAWVFQEVVLPRKSAFILQCSIENPNVVATVSLPTIHALCKIAWKHWNPTTVRLALRKRENLRRTSRYLVLQEMHDRWAERHKPSNTVPVPLEQVLSSLSAGAKTSTAQDQLYAFFGMNQNDQICLKPSYQAPLQDALVATARSIIKGTKSLDIFETVPRKTTAKTTRSWVPDFTSPRLVIPFLPSSAYTWSSNTRPEIYHWSGKCDWYTLWVHGKIVAVVDVSVDHHVATSKADINRAYTPLLLKVIQTWTNSRHYDPDVTLPVLESILPALLAEGHCEPSTYDAENTAQFATRVRNQYRDFSMRQLQDPARPNEFETRIHYRDAKKRTMAEYIDSVMNGRQLWITQDGRLATGSRLQKGDLLCIVHGCTHPVALRRVPKKDAYTVVSTCYLEDWINPWGRGQVDWAEDDAQEFALV
jgi:hypothetical protein